MDQTFDIPDSTDWLSTPLASLARLDSALRCQVCKDFFDNPVITSCCHTFCSLCIRRCLSAEAKCPTCRAPDQVLKLRNNWAMQECVDAFRESRARVLEFAKRGGDGSGGMRAEVDVEDGGAGADMEGPVPKKRKVDTDEDTPMEDSIRRRTRSQGSRTNNNTTPVQVVVDDIEDSNDGDYQPDDGLVPCPICSKRMKNEAVFSHLDRCTGPSKKTVPPEPIGSLRFPSSRNTPSTSSTTQPLQRLPTINYSLLKDIDLRRKLRELGIPDNGNRQLLQRRHTEWLNLWNANCDSNTPKSKRDLLRELDIWERSQGGQALGVPNKVMRKDFDSSAWSTAHTDDYRKLIADAQRKRDEVAAKAKEAVAEGSNDGKGKTTQQQPRSQPEQTALPRSNVQPGVQPQVLPPVQSQAHPDGQSHFQPQFQRQILPQTQLAALPQLHPQAHTHLQPQPYFPPQYHPQFQSPVPPPFQPHMQYPTKPQYQPPDPCPGRPQYQYPEHPPQQHSGYAPERQVQDSSQDTKSPNVEEPNPKCSQGSSTLENHRVMVKDTAAS